jgi:hypothetical protein
MRFRTNVKRVLGLILVFFAMGSSFGAAAPTQNVLTPAQWRKDLRELARKLTQNHRSPFHAVSKGDFEKAVASLDRRIPSLADHQVIVEMARLAAMIGDGHTRLSLPLSAEEGPVKPQAPTPAPAEKALLFHRLPIGVYLFKDGLFVQRTSAEFRHLLGAKVLRVGETPADRALEAVRGPRPRGHFAV